MKLAPIVLFVYNRPWHTQQTLNALAKNIFAAECDLFVFADGPKTNDAAELGKISETRKIIAGQQGFKSVTITRRDKNIGLASNVIEGLNSIFAKHESAIILEDDLITAPYFLDYCNRGLEMYKDDKHVFSINGFMFPIDFKNEEGAFLCPLATSSWGWASWADRWKHFENSPGQINEIQQNSMIRARFNLADYDYAAMLNNKNSWAVKWYYTAFIRNAVGLFPTKTLIENIGFDGSGTHPGNTSLYKDMVLTPLNMEKQERINLGLYARLLDYFTIKRNKPFPAFFLKFRKYYSLFRSPKTNVVVNKGVGL